MSEPHTDRLHLRPLHPVERPGAVRTGRAVARGGELLAYELRRPATG